MQLSIFFVFKLEWMKIDSFCEQALVLPVLSGEREQWPQQSMSCLRWLTSITIYQAGDSRQDATGSELLGNSLVGSKLWFYESIEFHKMLRFQSFCNVCTDSDYGTPIRGSLVSIELWYSEYNVSTITQITKATSPCFSIPIKYSSTTASSFKLAVDWIIRSGHHAYAMILWETFTEFKSSL